MRPKPDWEDALRAELAVPITTGKNALNKFFGALMMTWTNVPIRPNITSFGEAQLVGFSPSGCATAPNLFLFPVFYNPRA
jgi:hypothetical protein